MPTLKTFTATLESGNIGGRRATPEDTGAGIGAGIRGVGAVGQKAGEQILTMKENEEARSAIVESTKIREKYAKALDDAARTGADTSQLKEQMNNDLSAIGNDFVTKKGQDALSLQTANNNITFDSQANAIEVKRAAADAKLKGTEWLNAASAQLTRDPSSLKRLEGEASDFVDTFTNLPKEQRALIKQSLSEQLNLSAALSSAETDPEGTKSLVKAGNWNLTPEQRKAVESRADQQIRANRVDAEYQHTLSERLKKENNDTARDEYYKAIIGGNADKQSILNDERLQPATREHLIDLMHAEAKNVGDFRTNPSVFNTLRERIDSAPGTPNRIVSPEIVWQQYANHTLTKEDAVFLEKRIKTASDPSGRSLSSEVDSTVRNLKGQLDKSSLLSIDPGGGERVKAFTQYVWDQIDKYRADPNKDPRELLDPESKNYVGRAIPRFQTGAQRTQADIAARINQALEPRKSLDEIFK